MNKKIIFIVAIVIVVIICAVIFNNNKDETLKQNETTNVMKNSTEITKEEATEIAIQNAVEKIEKQGIKLKEERTEKLDVSTEITGYSYKVILYGDNNETYKEEKIEIYMIGAKGRMELFRNTEDGEVTLKTGDIEEKVLLYGNILIKYNDNNELKKIIMQAMD